MTLLLWAATQGGTPAAQVTVVARSSLLLGPYDLLDETSPVQLWHEQGDWDPGVAQPSAATVTTDMLDGSAVRGDRSENRNPILPLVFPGQDPVTRKPVDPMARAQVVNTVLRTVNGQTFPLTWTPKGGLPVVLDCFRATAPKQSSVLQEDVSGSQTFTVACQALPFARSVSPVTIPLVGAPLPIFSFDSRLAAVPGVSWDLQTVGQEEGTGYLRGFLFSGVPYVAGSSTMSVPVQRTQTLDLGGQSSVTIQIAYSPSTAILALTLTLIGASGRTYLVPAASLAGLTPSRFPAPTWTRITFPLAAAVSGDIATLGQPTGGIPELVTSWTVTADVRGISAGAPYPTISFDDLAAYPAASPSVLTARGGVYQLPNVPGSARAPVNLTLTGRSLFKTWLVHRPPADQPAAQPIIPLAQSAGGSTTWAGTAVAGSRYRGTFSAWLSLIGVAGNTGARHFTVTFAQTPGGQSRTLAVDLATVGAGTLIPLGVINLPVAGQPADGVSTFTATVTTSQVTDILGDLLLLSTEGESILGQHPIGYASVWVDEPDPLLQAPGVYASLTGARADAVSVAGSSWPLATPISVDPGPNQLLVYSPEGALTATATLYPRWLMDADQ